MQHPAAKLGNRGGLLALEQAQRLVSAEVGTHALDRDHWLGVSPATSVMVKKSAREVEGYGWQCGGAGR